MSSIASARDPARHVAIQVMPYYASGATPNDTPAVRVHSRYDKLLASNDPEAIRQVARAIEAEPGVVTPMTLMVLAIRHYDVGLRDTIETLERTRKQNGADKMFCWQ